MNSCSPDLSPSLSDLVDDFGLRAAHSYPQRQPDKAIGYFACYGQPPLRSRTKHAVGRRVQRDIMKDTVNAFPLHVTNEQCTLFNIRKQKVVHVGVVGTLARYFRKLNAPHCIDRIESTMVSIPNCEATIRYVFCILHLRPQECGYDFSWQKG
jgi:hypothetical protein